MKSKSLHPPLEAQMWAAAPRWVRLDDLSLGVFDCPHSTPKLTSDGPLVARSQDIRTGIFRHEDAASVSEETYRERITRAEPRHGDLLYSREGTYFGIAAEIPRGERVCLGQRMVLIRPRPEHVDTRFLRYWLNSPVMARHLEGFRDGSVAERLNLPTIRGLAVPVLPLAEQQAIAGVLGALDDKIELNRRMNRTLEEIARALFRSWFVDFEPVHAKAEGRAPAHMDPATAALFPTRFGEDGLPEGWRRRGLLDIADLISGGTPKTGESSFWDGGIAWASAKDVSQCGQLFLVDTERKVTELGLKKSSTKMVPAFSTVVVARGATTGRFCMFGREMAMNQTCYALRSTMDSPCWLNCLFSTLVGELTQAAHGSTFDTITTSTLRDARVTAPPRPVVEAFERMARPWLGKALGNIEQSRSLAALRDALLPKLMSGELRVREAERAVAEVV